MGKTIIERQIEMYRKCGIEDIIVVRGFAANKISYKGNQVLYERRLCQYKYGGVFDGCKR